MEALGTARLSDGVAADRAVTATISRGEIDDVLRQDGTPELVLRLADEGGAEQGRIRMAWSRDDLERLLAAATVEGVVLTFDRDELAAAFSDVEAHGLRTHAAIFAVAAAGALGSGAGAAYAQIPGVGSDVAAPIAAVSDSTVTDASTGGYAASAAPAAADSMVTDASTGGYTTSAAPAAADSMVTDASTGGYATSAAPAAADSMVTDASSAGGYTAAPGGSGSTFDIQRPADEAALIVGGVLLTLAGAAFAVRRTAPPRPA